MTTIVPSAEAFRSSDQWQSSSYLKPAPIVAGQLPDVSRQRLEFSHLHWLLGLLRQTGARFSRPKEMFI